MIHRNFLKFPSPSKLVKELKISVPLQVFLQMLADQSWISLFGQLEDEKT